MIHLLPEGTPLFALATAAAAMNFLRCLLWAGVAFAVFHFLLRGVLAARKIARRPTLSGQNRRDFGYSALSMAVFGSMAFIIVGMKMLGVSQMYVDIDEHGWTYFWLSIPLMLLIHDAWFYWTHRLMHHKRLFGVMHRVHHLSHDPTPWTAYAFHPTEAFVEALIGPVLVLIMPTHPLALFVFVTVQMTYNVLGHLGYELYPRWFMRTPLRYVLNTTTHHHQHHQKTNCNYGLYFNGWDRLMGTNHPDYEAAFEDNVRAADGVGNSKAPGKRASPAGRQGPSSTGTGYCTSAGSSRLKASMSNA
jgi:lathosterol oxidase